MSIKGTANHKWFRLWAIDLEIIRKGDLISELKLDTYDHCPDPEIIDGKLVPNADVIRNLMIFTGAGKDLMETDLKYEDLLRIIYRIRFTTPVTLLLGEEVIPCNTVGRTILRIVKAFGTKPGKEGEITIYDFDPRAAVFEPQNELHTTIRVTCKN